MSGENFEVDSSIIPEYTDVKSMYFTQFLVCQQLYSKYFLKPRADHEAQFRQSLVILCTSLSFKLNLLSDDVKKEKEFKDYFNYFLSNPDKFYSVTLSLPFSICNLLLNKMGFFDIEQKKVNKVDVYKEVY